MTQEDPQHPIVHCSHCGLVMHRQGAQVITIEPDGEMRVWTPERASYFLRYGQGHTPTLAYLCQACARDVFTSAAHADAERDERADHDEEPRA